MSSEEVKRELEFEQLKETLHADSAISPLTKEEREDPDRYKAQKMADLAEALGEGRLPTNEQVAAAVDKLEEEHAIGELTKELSSTGRKVGADVEKALETGKELLLEKNRGELLQRLVWYGSRAAKEIGASEEDLRLSRDVQQLLGYARLDIKQSIDRVVSLARLIATNGRFREILGDITSILKDALYIQVAETETGKEAIEAGKEVKEEVESSARDVLNGSSKDAAAQGPSHLELPRGAVVSSVETREIDQVASGLEVHTTRVVQLIEVSSGAQQSAGSKAPEQPVNGKDQASAKEIVKEVGGTAQQKAGEAKEELRDLAKQAEKQPLAETIKHGVDVIAEKIGELVPGSVQEKAKGAVGQTYEKVKEGKPLGEFAKDLVRDIKEGAGGYELPQDKKEELVAKMREAFNVLHRNNEFQRGVDELFEIVNDLMGKTTESFSDLQLKSEAAAIRVSDDVAEVRYCAKQLLENVADTSLDPLLEALKHLQGKMSNDTEFRGYLSEFKDYASDASKHPEKTMAVAEGEENEFYNRSIDLVSRGRTLVFEKYSSEVSKVIDLSVQFVDALRRDDLTNEFTSEIENLVKDMVLDDQGRPTVKFDLIQDLTKVVPKITQKLGYLPLPKIEQEDDDYRYILDNIVIKCTNIVPKFLHIATDTVIDADRPEGQQTRQIIKLTLSKIQASARDIAFFYTKKSGIIKPSDVGLLDFDIRGRSGITITVVLEPFLTAAPGEPVFRIHRVDTYIENLSLRLHKTHHNIMYFFLSPFIKNRVRRTLEEQIGNTIIDVFNQLNATIAETAKNVAESMGIKTAEPSAKYSAKVTRLPEWGSKAFNVEE